MPTEELKKLNRTRDWDYLSRAFSEAGTAVSVALDGGADEEVREAVGHYRRALVEVTQTSMGRNAADKNKIKALENRIMKVTGDLNKALIAGDRHAVRSALESLTLPAEE